MADKAEAVVTTYTTCCWCVPVKLDRNDVCTTCGKQWVAEEQS